jgi:hypothetical protein
MLALLDSVMQSVYTVCVAVHGHGHGRGKYSYSLDDLDTAPRQGSTLLAEKGSSFDTELAALFITHNMPLESLCYPARSRLVTAASSLDDISISSDFLKSSPTPSESHVMSAFGHTPPFGKTASGQSGGVNHNMTMNSGERMIPARIAKLLLRRAFVQSGSGKHAAVSSGKKETTMLSEKRHAYCAVLQTTISPPARRLKRRFVSMRVVYVCMYVCMCAYTCVLHSASNDD